MLNTEVYMEIGLIIIFALRLLVPLTILRWPLYGAIASLVIDAADTNIVKLFGTEIPDYVTTDKYLDMYYLTIELIVSLRWPATMFRNASVGLFLWRMIGVAAFELQPANRFFLFLAPNIFEHYFLLITYLLKKHNGSVSNFWINSYPRLLLIIVILWLTKVPQELVLHVYKVSSPVETFIDWIKQLVAN